MKNKSKSILKVLAAVVAVILIGGILFITNAFVGNPISSMMANKAITEYVDRNYSFLDLETEKPIYNFKDGNYIVRARSKTSIDTRFTIYYRNGKVERDTYEDYVLGRYNTLDRLAGEYSNLASKIIAKELGFHDNTTRVMYKKYEYKNLNDLVELDMKLDKSLAIDTEVSINIELKDNSLEEMSKLLMDTHKVFLDNNCYFQEYSLSAENDEMLVMIFKVTPRDIESGQLLELLKAAEDNVDDTIIKEGQDKEPIEGISIFRKDKNK